MPHDGPQNSRSASIPASTLGTFTRRRVAQRKGRNSIRSGFAGVSTQPGNEPENFVGNPQIKTTQVSRLTS